MTEPTATNTVTTAKKRSDLAGIILFGIAAWSTLIGITAYSLFSATGGIVDAADAFFDQIHKNDQAGAYELISNGFKSSTDLPAFQAFITTNALDHYSSQTWSSQQTAGTGDGATGNLKGSLKQINGTDQPITLSLIKESGGWRIDTINLGKVKASTERTSKTGPTKTTKRHSADTVPSAETVPNDSALKTLIHNTDVAFAKAVAARSMEGFHKRISGIWSKKHTTEELDGYFESFYENDIDLMPLRDLAPIFKQPATINSDGLLIVTGHYDMDPNRSDFTHKYTFEGIEWKLIGYSFNIAPVARVKKKLRKFKKDVVESKYP